jgi:hypothetical protein
MNPSHVIFIRPYYGFNPQDMIIPHEHGAIPFEEDDMEFAIKESIKDQGISPDASNPEDRLRVPGGPIGLANVANCMIVK